VADRPTTRKELDCAFILAHTHRPDETFFKKHITCIKTSLYSTQNKAAVLTMAIPSLSKTNKQHTKHT
jgi:hypothetical protein